MVVLTVKPWRKRERAARLALSAETKWCLGIGSLLLLPEPDQIGRTGELDPSEDRGNGTQQRSLSSGLDWKEDTMRCWQLGFSIPSLAAG